jgi:hypothetical protein
MRKKPGMQNSGGGYKSNKPRYQGHHQSHHQGGSGGGNNRPRKNYAASREKYLAQARDALAAGDRVLAENYFQHAEHCYRMMVEEGYHTRNQQQQPQQGDVAQQAEAGQQPMTEDSPEEIIRENSGALPAFLTAGYQAGQTAPATGNEAPAVQDWEERDSA